MAGDNFETVQRFIEALGHRDYALAISMFSPDAEWHNTASFPGATVCRGAAEIRAFWTTLFESFERDRMTIERSARSGDTVVTGVHSRGRGRSSGAPIDVRWALIVHLGDGSIERVDVYGDYDRALEAAGIVPAA
jgi:ketosteroid isomerase-like protein